VWLNKIRRCSVKVFALTKLCFVQLKFAFKQNIGGVQLKVFHGQIMCFPVKVCAKSTLGWPCQVKFVLKKKGFVQLNFVHETKLGIVQLVLKQN
jgi:hypothetical protein